MREASEKKKNEKKQTYKFKNSREFSPVSYIKNIRAEENAPGSVSRIVPAPLRKRSRNVLGTLRECSGNGSGTLRERFGSAPAPGTLRERSGPRSGTLQDRSGSARNALRFFEKSPQNKKT